MTKLIKNTYSYFFEFYPTKRSRKLRKGMKEDFFFTYLLEVEDKEFPLAFKVQPMLDLIWRSLTKKLVLLSKIIKTKY